MLVPSPISRRDQKGVPSLSAATPSLGAAEIVTDNRCLGEEASWGLLELAADLLPRLMAPAT